MWVSRKPSPVCCRPIQNVGDRREAVADGAAPILHDPCAAEGSEDGVVEGGALFEVGALDGHVSEHGRDFGSPPVIGVANGTVATSGVLMCVRATGSVRRGCGSACGWGWACRDCNADAMPIRCCRHSRLVDGGHPGHGVRDPCPRGGHLCLRAVRQPGGPGGGGGVPGQSPSGAGHLPDTGPDAEDPVGGRPLGSISTGDRASAELVDGSIYLAISVRNVGLGPGRPDRVVAELGGMPGPTCPHDDPDSFRPQTRDLYVAPSDMGFWQAAIRPQDPTADPGLRMVDQER